MASTEQSPAGCPHHEQSSGSKSADKDGNCGFGSKLMQAAQHPDGWEVSTDSSSSSNVLSRDREVSSIPKTNEFTPDHQTGKNEHWEYPSEDMYFKAMKRKGWAPETEQMRTIVAIHNAVNEQSWKQVLEWESFHPAKEAPKLKRFIGKPKDLSPKARIMTALGWAVEPFDRHDWIVERDGKEVRYVIDFYSGQPSPGRPLSVYLDVRPALDSMEGAFDRLKWQFREKVSPLLPFRGQFGGQKVSDESKPESNFGRSAVEEKK